MSGEDREIRADVKAFLERLDLPIDNPTRKINATITVLDQVMHSVGAPEFSRLIQKWVACT